MPLQKVFGIRPGGGKKANEFDDIDREDAEIAAAEDAKGEDHCSSWRFVLYYDFIGQAGIPPGSDHPKQTSQHSKAVKVSKEKAKRDLVIGDEREKMRKARYFFSFLFFLS